MVGVIVAALVVGGIALTRFGPDIKLVEVGARAPDFRALNLATGDSVSFREHYKGAVTLVNIWATWCLPCRVEMPGMDSVYQTLGPRGFKIAAVSIDEGNSQDVRDFAQDLGISFDVLQDRTGVVQQIYQTTGVPESFLINKDGIIVKRLIGEHAWNSPVNRKLIQALLDQTGA
jgi:thiol-disulfide isomerase/thioredoxin